MWYTKQIMIQLLTQNIASLFLTSSFCRTPHSFPLLETWFEICRFVRNTLGISLVITNPKLSIFVIVSISSLYPYNGRQLVFRFTSRKSMFNNSNFYLTKFQSSFYTSMWSLCTVHSAQYHRKHHTRAPAFLQYSLAYSRIFHLLAYHVFQNYVIKDS